MALLVHLPHDGLGGMPVTSKTAGEAGIGSGASKGYQLAAVAAEVEFDIGLIFAGESFGDFEQIEDAFIAFDSPGEKNAERWGCLWRADSAEGFSAIGRQKRNDRRGAVIQHRADLFGDVIRQAEDGRSAPAEKAGVEAMDQRD